MKKYNFTLYLVLLVFQLAFTQSNDNAKYDISYKYSAEQLQSDFIILRWILERVHPGLYAFIPKETLQAQLDSTYKRLNKPMTEEAFYRTIAPVIANIRCGHTLLDPSYRYQDAGKRFPLDLKFIDEKAYILHNYLEDVEVPLGAEVLSINGRSMQSIIETLMPNIAGDALHSAAQYQSLEEDFQNFYNIFIGKPDTFKLKCLNLKSKDEINIKVPAKDDAFLKEYDKRYIDELTEYKTLDFKILRDSIGLLTIRSFLPFDIKTSQQKFNRFIRRTFEKIRDSNINNLIIDLRANAGGEMLYANELYSYLTTKPYQFLDRVEVTTNQKLDLKEFQNLARNTVHNPRRIEKTDSGTYVVSKQYYRFLVKQMPKKRFNFTGNLYVLIGKKSFSASALFASLVYANKRGVFVGQETGGAAIGLNGGDFIDIALPITNLVLEVPLERWIKDIPDYPFQDRGIVPHYRVSPSIEDIIKQKDKVLNYTLDLIK